MKLQNIFALIVTLIGFAACTSESELPDTPVSGDLVPVTISLGSIQTKAGVGLDTDEGTIQNAVIGIFDSKGIPTVAPIVLNNMSSGTTRLPLIKSRAYAFVNVSDADIEALKAISSENAFKTYQIQKQLSQKASELPKYGMLEEFTPVKDRSFTIPVYQMTARLDVSVEVIVKENGADVTSRPDIVFSKTSLSWDNILNETEVTTVSGNDGTFTTEIDGKKYDVINRTYSYPGAKPTINLTGSVNGKEINRSYTFKDDLAADNVYVILMKMIVDLNSETEVSFDYEIITKEPVEIKVPDFK